MKIHLDSARSGPVEWEESLSFDPAEVGCEVGDELSAVAVRGRLSESEDDLWLDLAVEFEVRRPCDRCGKPVASAVRATSRMLVTRRPRHTGDGEIELTEDDLGVVEVAGEALESRPLVAEQVQLEMPTRPLCREECRGLCPSCGEDRNERVCECEDEAADPRWSALAELKGRLGAPH